MKITLEFLQPSFPKCFSPILVYCVSPHPYAYCINSHSNEDLYTMGKAEKDREKERNRERHSEIERDRERKRGIQMYRDRNRELDTV